MPICFNEVVIMEKVNPLNPANTTLFEDKTLVTIHYSDSGPSLQSCMTALLQSHMCQTSGKI
ncbi:hypothetical protein OBV_17700 [Oscillibacter valericigenes Sjm18-20]|nr:hypothetical protein OBV_17700 [Oscillibacter valericigenes Sjm18-20]